MKKEEFTHSLTQSDSQSLSVSDVKSLIIEFLEPTVGNLQAVATGKVEGPVNRLPEAMRVSRGASRRT